MSQEHDADPKGSRPRLFSIDHNGWDADTIRNSTNNLLNRLKLSDRYKKALSHILHLTEAHALGIDTSHPRSDPHLLLRDIRLVVENALAAEPNEAGDK